MKKIFTILAAVTICSVASGAGLDGRINLRDKVHPVDKPMKAAASNSKTSSLTAAPSSVTPVPLKSPDPRKASMERKSVLLYEDFNNVPDGETEQTGNIGERYIDFLASKYYEPGRYIDNEYTPESGTWEGDWVYAGKNGTVIIQSYNPMSGGHLSTPLGDYSGDITVTMRVRYAKTFWGADNEVGYVSTGGSSIDMCARIHGYDSNDIATTDMEFYSQMSSGQIYEADGWQELTFKFRNESANKDGYITFGSRDAIEIDWIKITDDNTFLPTPVVNAPTNFTNDGFTINWDPVRRSYNYYIDLYKTVYTADSGLDEFFGFEDATPEWLLCGDGETVEGEGVDGSMAWAPEYSGENAALTTLDMGKKIEAFSSMVKFRLDDEDSPLTLIYDVYGDNGWEPYGYLQCDGWWTSPGYYYSVELNDANFSGKYSAVRVYADGINEDNGVYIDDMKLYAKRPYVLERVYDDYFSACYDPEDDDYSYNYYTYTGVGTKIDPNDPGRSATHYAFTGLDPETEYWYRVRSHNVYDFTVGEKYHAFGVAAPQLLDATNVNSSSYTANWKDAPKAQKYTVTSYTGTLIEEANPEYTLLAESFPNCEGSMDFSTMDPIDNPAECYLDNYTDLRGWRGKNNYVGQNMIGGADYAGSYLITPAIMANPNRGTLYIYIEGRGIGGDNLYVSCLKSGAYGYFPFDEEGEISGWLEVPAVEGEQIRFSSYNGLGFALLAFEAVQAVEPGDIVRRFDASVEVPAGEQAYTFSNLDGKIYAYNVVSVFTLEGETAYSTAYDTMFVNLETGESNMTGVEDVEMNGNAVETARFSLEGMKVGKDHKGVVIVKMSDGTVKKMIEK